MPMDRPQHRATPTEISMQWHLDLKILAQISKLIKSKISDYDIVIEQFRPGVMRKIRGLDYQTLSEN